MSYLLRGWTAPLIAVIVISSALVACAAEKQGKEPVKVVKVEKVGLTPGYKPDGDPTKWKNPKWYVLKSGDIEVGKVSAAHDGKTLYLIYVVNDKSPLKNRGQDFQNHYKEGDSVDLMFGPYRSGAQGPGEGDMRLLFVPLDPPVAVVYRQVMHGADPDFKTQFTSPVRSISMDYVSQVDDVTMVFKPTADGYTAEVAIPFTRLDFQYSPGKKALGDFGILSSNDGGMITERRCYLFNERAHVVMDVPTEAELLPNQWFDFEFE